MNATLALAFGAGMLSTVNPCGFAMLPAFLAYYISDREHEPRSLPQRLTDGLTAGVAVSLGFAGVFIAAGLLVALGLRGLVGAVPWLALVIGLILAVVGVVLLAGRPLPVRLPQRAVPLPASGPGRLVVFGVAYAVASLSCTLAVLLAVIAQALATADAWGLIAVFLAYGAGASAVLLLLGLSASLASGAIAAGLRRLLPMVHRVAGAVLTLAGGYLVVYWAPVVTGSRSAGRGVLTGPSAAATAWLASHQGVIVLTALAAMAVTGVVLAFHGRRRRESNLPDIRLTEYVDRVPEETTMTNQGPATLRVDGMTCGSCAAHVGKALQGAGIAAPQVDWRAGLARFDWPETVDESSIAEAVRDAGYRPGELTVARTPAPPEASGAGDVDYDLLVLGAGSAAFAAAIKAREAGRTVALVESGTLGGTCVNVGCVPSKALLRAGELAWAAGHHPHVGIATSSGPVDLKALVAAKDDLVAGLRQAKYADLVDEYGFTVLPGRARFVAPDTVEVDGRRITAGAFLIAAGAAPAIPPIPGLAEAGYLTSTTALDLEEVPRRLAVIGASAIGLELGQFFLHVGSQVSFLDVAERIAPFEEPEISAALTEYLEGQGATVLTGARIEAVRRDGENRVVTGTRGGETFQVTADQVLVATGRRPNTDGLGLDAAGVTVDERGRVVVDEKLRTTNPRVWAAGDVTAAAQFVYVSAYQGALAADNALLGADRRVDLTGLPRVTFTAPQIAGAGLTEAKAREAGYDVKTSVLPLSAVPRALVNRETHGLVKLVADAATDRLLGASMLAESAGEAIQAAVLAIRLGLTTEQLAATFHPYLTMVEGVKLAAQTFTRDVEKLSCCAA